MCCSSSVGRACMRACVLLNSSRPRTMAVLFNSVLGWKYGKCNLPLGKFGSMDHHECSKASQGEGSQRSASMVGLPVGGKDGPTHVDHAV